MAIIEPSVRYLVHVGLWLNEVERFLRRGAVCDESGRESSLFRRLEDIDWPLGRDQGLVVGFDCTRIF
jgi:hypothetical protein